MRFARCLLLSLLFVGLSVGAFSHSCYASETVLDDELTIIQQIYRGGTSTQWNSGYVVNNQQVNFSTGTIREDAGIDIYLTIKRLDGTTLIRAGSTANIEVSNAVLYGEDDYGNTLYPFNKSTNMVTSASNITFGGYDAEGKWHDVEANITIKANSGYGRYAIRISADEMPCDLVSLKIRHSYANLSDVFPWSPPYNYSTMFITGGFRPDNTAIVSISSEEAGLLKRILSKLQQIGGGIDSIVSGILELPNKIVDGIKSLFIPDEDFIVSFKDKFDKLLKDHFGCVYESVSYIVDFAESIAGEVEAKNAITMPATTINLAGTDFTFGGFEFKIVPDKFDFLANAVKFVIGVMVTFAFIFMLKRRYEEVISK